MKFRVGDLVEQKSNGTRWIVTKTQLSAYSPQGYCVTVQRSTFLKTGHGGSRTDYPMYYALICRPGEKTWFQNADL